MKCTNCTPTLIAPSLIIIVLAVIALLLFVFDASFVYPSFSKQVVAIEHPPTPGTFVRNISIKPTPHPIPVMVTNTNIDDIDDFYRQSLSEILEPSKRKVTLIVNACGRVDLLNRTISSFMKYYPHSTYPLQEKILIDDCRQKNDAFSIIKQYMPDFEIMFSGDSVLLQLHNHDKDYRISTAIDKTHKQVTTEWIYHLEEDWEFSDYGFMDDAFNIFEHSLLNDSQHKYSIVLCRTIDFNPVFMNDIRVDPKHSYKNTTWNMMKETFGFTFNAGLYPTFVYNRYGPFISDIDNSAEGSISKRMSHDNLRVAFLENPKCYHIGGGRGVKPKKLDSQ